MAGHRQHEIVMLGRHGLDVGAERPPECEQPLDRRLVRLRRRGEDAPAIDEQLGEAGVRPGMLRAGDRMRRDESARRSARAGPCRAPPQPFTEPTSESDRAGLQMRGDLLGDRSALADRDAQDHEVRAGGRGGVGLDHLIGDAELDDAPACRRATVRWRRCVRTTPWARAARAIEEPIRPTPISASRSNSGPSLMLSALLPFMNSASDCDDEPVRLLGADGHAQRVGELVGADLAQDQAARGEKGVGLLGRAALLLGKVDQHEVGDARRHFEPELADLLGQPGEPARVVLRARSRHARRH